MMIYIKTNFLTMKSHFEFVALKSTPLTSMYIMKNILQITSKKMSMCEFIDNLAYTGFNYDRGLLKTLYTKVKNQPFKSHEPPPTTRKFKPRMSNAMLANQFVKQITDQVDCEFWTCIHSL